MRLDKQEVVTVLKNYGAETSVIEAEYYKLYQAKHGIDLRKLEADYDARRVGPPPQHDDQELYRRILKEKVADRVGFIVAAEGATLNPRPGPRQIGPLKNVRLREDTAIGDASETISDRGDGLGQSRRRGPIVIEDTFRFRKTKDGWFISGLGSQQ
jgi:hypothetical protein